MNKILEFIRKHSKITVILIILCSLLPLIIVHILFKWKSGIAFLVAEWSAGELLGYIGTLLSFWGTIILGWLALQASNKANELSRRVIELEQDHYRLEMRPFVLVSNWKAYEVDSRELVNDPKKKFIQIGSHKGEKVLGLSIELTNTTESVITVQYNCGTARTRDLCWGNAAVNQENLKMTLSPGEKDEFVFYAGEYVVSELARETMISKLDYLDIPLAELVGKKRSGNPGFDFHSQNKTTDTVIFGEAKYVTATTAYSSALPQIVDFIGDEKDVEDLPELKPFCTTSALQRAANGIKGFSAAFSAKTTSTDRIIANIKKRSDFQALLQYEELILVAVDL